MNEKHGCFQAFPIARIDRWQDGRHESSDFLSWRYTSTIHSRDMRIQVVFPQPQKIGTWNKKRSTAIHISFQLPSCSEMSKSSAIVIAVSHVRFYINFFIWRSAKTSPIGERRFRWPRATYLPTLCFSCRCVILIENSIKASILPFRSVFRSTTSSPIISSIIHINLLILFSAFPQVSRNQSTCCSENSSLDWPSRHCQLHQVGPM